jgi:predicted ATPase
MGIFIKNIQLPDDDYIFISDDGSSSNVLLGLSKINIFIGENNSGKSRLMRSILKTEDFEFIPTNEDLIHINKFIMVFDSKLKILYKNKGWMDVEGLNKVKANLKHLEFLKANINHLEPIMEIQKHIAKVSNKHSIDYQTNDGGFMGLYNLSGGEPALKGLVEIYNDSIKYLNDVKGYYKFKKVYIPILRGLKPINYGTAPIEVFNGKVTKGKLPDDYNRDVYEERILDDYPELMDKCEIFTGLKTYETYTDYIGHLEDRKQELLTDFEVLLSEIIYEQIKVTALTNDSEESKLSRFKIKIGEEQGRVIQDLGDGIQSILTITFPLLIHEDEIKEQDANLMMFIEEPEQLLHPSLQRKLVNVFLNKRFDDYQFFLTTHSNHFLDISLDTDDVSVYSISKSLDENNNSKFLIKKVSFGDNELLELLGVRNSSVFNTNCNIGVEGKFDQLYLRKYLEIYQNHKIKGEKDKKFIEDRHFSFSRYCGDSIKNNLEFEWNEDESIHNLFVIRDGDKRNKTGVNQKLENIFGTHFHILESLEIENLISKDVLLKVLKNDDVCKGITLNKEFEEDDYKNVKLGKFIKETICGNQITSDLVANKRAFYNKTAEYTVNYDDLSKETKELCGRLYNFIEAQNTG